MLPIYTIIINNILIDNYLHAITISRKDIFKDLGVIIVKKRSFVPHICSVIKKASNMLGFTIRASRNFSESFTRQLLYFSYVRSRLQHLDINKVVAFDEINTSTNCQYFSSTYTNIKSTILGTQPG